jgi:hypothetical protein
VFGVKTGVLIKLFARHIRAFSALNISFILTAKRYGAFSMKRMSVCFDAAFAAAGLPE